MVTLRKAVPEDFGQIAQWLSNREISRWLSSEWRNRDVTPTIIAMLARTPRNAVYMILRDATPCGMAAFSEIDTVDKTANVWYFLGDQSLAGKGVTTDAIRQFVGLAFGELQFNSLSAWAMENNTRSQRVLEKAGFKRVGKVRHSATFEEKPVDRIYFDLLPTDL
jgi:RimJ/RimL family protein N-acetyltransferase